MKNKVSFFIRSIYKLSDKMSVNHDKFLDKKAAHNNHRVKIPG